MSTITYDGQSFIVDSRRTWLVSGAIHYPRVPHELWRDRIRAAKQAGLNCIETYVFWNLHEPTPGRFTWEGQADLRRFVELIGKEGMYCILRPGPYVCAEWEFGGFPWWLLNIEGLRLREASQPFLEACARYLKAVMEQVRDLQITTPTEGLPPAPASGNVPGEAAGGYTGGGRGPILMVQAENEWFCHNPEQAELYLNEIVRYLRESGCEVPINNCNNLWQRIDGTIDTWNANRHLAADLRQLAVVQPNAPRLVSEYWPGWFDYWGGKHNVQVDASLHLYRMAQILAAGAQYNLYMFHGGTNFAFWGCRLGGQADWYQTTSYDYDAPLLEAGGRGAKYDVTKRISTFASQFHHVFAHLAPDQHPAALAPTEEDHDLSVVHLTGAQGDVVFLLRGQEHEGDSADLLLPNGLTLTVPLGEERAAWLLIDANLGGVTRLEYTNLRPWAFLQKKMLVLFGPAGSEGIVALDGVQINVKVPTGREPRVEAHEDLRVVVLSTEQVDETYITANGLAVGAHGVDDQGNPRPRRGRGEMVLVDLEGQVTRQSVTPPRRPAAPRLTGWQVAPQHDLVDGSSDAYQKIDGPASLEALNVDYGYGWYRIGVGAAKRGKVFAPLAGDRLHVYSGGKLQGILGHAPGASDEPVQMSLSGDVVVLADNLGRTKIGDDMFEPRGLYDHLYAVRQARLARPKVVQEPPPDPFELRGFLFGRRRGEVDGGQALVWNIKPASRSRPMILEVRDLPVGGVFSINGHVLGVYNRGWSTRRMRFVLMPGENGVTAGQNELKLALLDTLEPRLNVEKHIRLYQVTQVLTNRGQWAFARWTQPDQSAFGRLGQPPGGPAWYRAQFSVSDASMPLWLEPRGLSKGQIYLNGHNVGRYFVATHQGRAVPPQRLYYLPEPWLKTDEPNELVLFDEHGKDPRKARLVYDPMGPFNQ